MNTQLITAGILVVYHSADRFSTISSFHHHINHHHSMNKGGIIVTELGSTKYDDRPSKTFVELFKAACCMWTEVEYGASGWVGMRFDNSLSWASNIEFRRQNCWNTCKYNLGIIFDFHLFDLSCYGYHYVEHLFNNLQSFFTWTINQVGSLIKRLL